MLCSVGSAFKAVTFFDLNIPLRYQWSPMSRSPSPVQSVPARDCNIVVTVTGIFIERENPDHLMLLKDLLSECVHVGLFHSRAIVNPDYCTTKKSSSLSVTLVVQYLPVPPTVQLASANASSKF
jgi:hypothetical protein